MTSPSRPLTPKQARFVAEYQLDANATQSAIRAGYSEHTAYSQGQRLLKHVEVQQALQQVTATAIQVVAREASEAVASAEWIIEQSLTLIRRCMAAEPVLNARGEATGEYRFDSAGANKSLDRLAKMHPSVFSPDATNIDARTLNIQLPEGTTLDDLKALRAGLSG